MTDKVIVDNEFEEAIEANTKYAKEKDFLLALENAYLTYDASEIEDKLDRDFTYSSFWVFETLDGAAEYIEYLTGKLNTLRKAGYAADYCLVKQKVTGKPILLVKTEPDAEDYACFVAEANEAGLIVSLGIMPASFYKWEP